MKAKKVKNAKKEFISLLCIGIIVIIITSIGFLTLYRPFANWKKFDFSKKSDVVLGFEYDGTYIATYHYKINDIEYRKSLKGIRESRDSHDDSHAKYILYISMNNPNDVKPANFGTPVLFASIGFGALGIVLIWFAFYQKKRILKKQAKEGKSNRYLRNK